MLIKTDFGRTVFLCLDMNDSTAISPFIESIRNSDKFFPSTPVRLSLFHKQHFLQEVYYQPITHFESSTIIISAALAYLESINMGLHQLLEYSTQAS